MPHAPAGCSPEAAHRCSYLPLAKSRTPHAHTAAHAPHHGCLAGVQDGDGDHAGLGGGRHGNGDGDLSRACSHANCLNLKKKLRPTSSNTRPQALGRRVLYWFPLAYLTLLLAARRKPHTAAPICRSPEAARHTRTPLLTRRTPRAAPWMPRWSPRWRWRPRRTRRRSPRKWRWRWRPPASVQPCKLPESQKKLRPTSSNTRPQVLGRRALTN